MSIFRELFVEVPQALLEAAVRDAEERQRRWGRADSTLAASLHVGYEWAIRHIGIERGWTWCETFTRSTDRQIGMRVLLKCGHGGAFYFDEQALFLADKPGLVDYILDVIEKPPARKCYCVQYEPPVPCATGECR